MSEIYGLDFRPKIIQEGLCMARRKVKITDFIQTCETTPHTCGKMVPVLKDLQSLRQHR